MISIVIPVYHKEQPGYVEKTLTGIRDTIGVNDYKIIMVGSLPEGLELDEDIDFLEGGKLGDSKNKGAKHAVENYNPDTLVFCDAHMEFRRDTSMNWGSIIRNHLNDNPDHIVGPAIHVYSNPHQRGFGVISEIKEDDISMDLAWKWWGAPKDKPFKVPGLCGCFMAMRSETFRDSICGYTPPLAIDDREFSLRMWLLGHDIVSIPNVSVGHRFASGFTDLTKERSIDWGSGHLLYAFLIGEDFARKLYYKDVSASQDKDESWRRAKKYWDSIKDSFERKRARLPREYFERFGEGFWDEGSMEDEKEEDMVLALLPRVCGDITPRINNKTLFPRSSGVKSISSGVKSIFKQKADKKPCGCS